jgi:diguanylate cyclase (GGDEF)-like protein
VHRLRPASRTAPPLGPAVAAFVALTALVATLLLDGSPLWIAAWAAIGVGLATAVLGPLLGAAAGVGALIVAWALPPAPGGALGDDAIVQLAGIALLAWGAGAWSRAGSVGRVSAAEAGRRRTRLLAEAVLPLETASDPDGVLAALPPLVTRVLAVHHASVLRLTPGGPVFVRSEPPCAPVGAVLPERSVVARAARTGRVQWVPDARRDPDYHGLEGLSRDVSELAIPLRLAGRVHAVLNVERERVEGFDADDRATLEALARVAESDLERLATLSELERQRHEADVLARVAQRLAQVDDARRAARITLSTLLDALGLDGGVVFHVDRGQFRPLALADGLPADVRPALERGVAWGRGRLHHVWQRGEGLFEEDYAVTGLDPGFRALGVRALASVPVRDSDGETMALIEAGSFVEARAWSAADRRLIETVASTLGAVLARITVREREAELLEVVRQLARASEPAELYQRVVDAAVRIVPGAEAASLLTRTPEGDFVFGGAAGFDLKALREVRLTEAGQLAWYAGGESDWRAGKPRLLTGHDVAITSSASAGGVHGDVLADAGRTSEIRASLCVPIALQEEVMAILNVDAFSRDEAFGVRAIALAQALGDHVAVIVRQAHDREALARSALTDPLTGLGNREAFNRTLARELQRTRRYGEPVALAMLDLNGFKVVNDTLGHAAGDRALVAVAAALRATVRASDAAFRWGGDEFAVVMPTLAPDAGAAAAQRLVRAIAAIDVDGLQLRASVGLANAPRDGDDADTLLRRADDLMYEIKGSGEPPR